MSETSPGARDPWASRGGARLPPQGRCSSSWQIQQAVHREMLGRVFGLVTTAPFAGSTLAYAAGGFLLDLTSPRTVFLIGGIGVLVVLLPVLLVLWRERPDDQDLERGPL